MGALLSDMWQQTITAVSGASEKRKGLFDLFIYLLIPIAANPMTRYTAAYTRNQTSLMSKNNHVPARKAIEDTNGRFHIRRIFLPQLKPSIAE